ncbi:MAG: hypothetical protein ACRENI_14065 [Gemmatimonadaceae bacterium]
MEAESLELKQRKRLLAGAFRCTCVSFVFTALLSVVASAQATTAPPVAEGTYVRLRLSTHSDWAEGTLIEWGPGDTLALAHDDETLRIALADIERIDVSEDYSSLFWGALLGTGIGAVTGTALVYADWKWTGFLWTGDGLALLPYAVVLPTATGGVIGFILAGHDWETLRLSGARVSLGLDPAGSFSAGMSLSF